MNQKGISSITIILIIVGILVIAGGIWAWQSQKEKPVACTQDTKLCPDGSYVSRTGPNCEFAACPETKDETANWKTYKNKEYGFEIRYPNDWLIEGNQDSVYFKRTDISQEEMERMEIGYPLSILVENTSAESIFDWFENSFSDRPQNLKPEKHSITIGGINGIRYSDPISMGGCDETFATIKNRKLFRFLRHGSTCNYSNELFTNIVSTFKFVK